MNHRFKKKKKHFSFFAYIFLSAGQDYGKKCRETLSCQESKNVLSEEAPQKNVHANVSPIPSLPKDN